MVKLPNLVTHFHTNPVLARLTSLFLLVKLPWKKRNIVDNSTISILFTLRPWYHNSLLLSLKKTLYYFEL
jgi:hypothetical protein